MRLLRVLTCAATAAAVAMPQVAQAQSNMAGTTETPAIGFGILGGATFPVGDYNKAAATGFNIGAFVDFGRRLGPLGIRADVLYHGFGDTDVVRRLAPGTQHQPLEQVQHGDGHAERRLRHSAGGLADSSVSHWRRRRATTSRTARSALRVRPRARQRNVHDDDNADEVRPQRWCRHRVRTWRRWQHSSRRASIRCSRARRSRLHRHAPSATALALQIVPVNLGVRIQF